MNWKRKNHALLHLICCGALALPLLRLLAIPHVFDTGPLLIREVYVDAANGNDSNPGDSSGAAFKTLEAAVIAIQVNQSDGVVHVLPGTYSGEGNRNLDFGGRNIRIVSTAGAENTVVDLGGMGGFLSLHSKETAESSLEGLTIRNGVNDSSAVVDLEGASLTITGCVLADNEGMLGAVSVSGGSLAMSDTRLSGNYAWDGAGALNAFSDASVTVTGCDFQGNHGYCASAALVDFADADFARCVFQGNSCIGTGAAVVVRSDDTDDCLGLENCLVQGNQDFDGPYGLSGVAAYGAAGLSLLNCTVQGDGTLVHAEGVALLENSIVDGGMELSSATLADSNYTPENLDGYGSGNLQGDDPGVNPDGTLAPDSPCIDAGNSAYASGTDLTNTPRDDGAPDIGSDESGKPDKSDPSDPSDKSDPSDPSGKSGSNKPPEEYNPYHDYNYAFRPGYVTLDCGEFRATGRNYGALKSLLEGKFASQLEWDCHWDYAVPVRNDYGRIVDYNYGTQDCTAARISPRLDDFQNTLRRHPVFSDQFSPNFYIGQIHFGCEEEPKSKPVSVDVRDHELGWTDMASEDHPCSLEGAMPESNSGYLVKQDVNVPFGQILSMKVEWKGLDLSDEASWHYDAPEDAGCKILKAMGCRKCGMEKVIDPDPMPEWYRRILYHRNCYFTPEVSSEEYPEALKAAKEVSAMCPYGGAYFWESAALNLDGTGADSWNRDYNTWCDRTGGRDFTFRKACLEVTVHPEEYCSWLNFGTYTLNRDIKLSSCGEGSFTYHVNTVGIGDFSATAKARKRETPSEEDNSSEESSAETGGTGEGGDPQPDVALSQAVLVDGNGYSHHYLFVPSMVDPTKNSAADNGGRVRDARPVTRVTFHATPEGGPWPAEADYPTGEYPAGNEGCYRESWKFPTWSISGSASYSYYGPWGYDDAAQPVERFSLARQAIANRMYDGKDSVHIPFDNAPGRFALTVGCHAENWWGYFNGTGQATPGNCPEWNPGEKTLNILVCDIRMDMPNGDRESPLPMLLLNDDCDDEELIRRKLDAHELFWKDGGLKPDLDRTTQIFYSDDDLKPVRINVTDVFGNDTAILDKLYIRVTPGAGIRLHGDAQKRRPSAFSLHWRQENDSWLYRIFDQEAYQRAVNNNCWDLAQNLEKSLSCRLYAEGVAAGQGEITATLLVAQEDGSLAEIVSEKMKVPVVKVALAPDYDRDGAITDEEERFALLGRPLRMWYNTNRDSDLANQFDFEANGRANCDNDKVDGYGDLLDFFPVWLDTSEFLKLERDGMRLGIRLRHDRNEMNALFTDMGKEAANVYLTNDQSPKAIPVPHDDGMLAGGCLGVGSVSDMFDFQEIYHAKTYSLSGLEAPPAFLEKCHESGSAGIILCEGKTPCRATSDTASRLWMELYATDKNGRTFTLASRALYTSISDVHDMLRYYNLRGTECLDMYDGLGKTRTVVAGVREPSNMPDDERDDSLFFFVHGFNVDAEESYDWAGRFFKRLHQSGSDAKFVGVDWNGNAGGAAGGCYQWNVENAFRTAPCLKLLVDMISGGEKVAFAAHSLGNMLVSSAIQDHEMDVDSFFMLNAAVAAEAFDEDAASTAPANDLVPPPWKPYPARSWSAQWHSHHPNDDRGKLTWRNRFKDVPSRCALVNYFDSTDEVLGIIPADFLWLFVGTRLESTSGGESNGSWDAMLTVRRQAWQKQEYGKGGFIFNCESKTTEAGWGFWNDGETHASRYGDSLVIPSHVVRMLTDEELSLWENTVFRRNPHAMNETVISNETRNHLLAYAIPALSKPAGIAEIGKGAAEKDLTKFMSPPNGYPRNDKFTLNRVYVGNPEGKIIWSHSDFMLVPYFYTHGLYEDMVSRF